MVTQYSVVNWEFDIDKWSELLAWMHEDFTYDEMGEIIGVTVSCVKNWERQNYKMGFERPNLKNLLIVCNLLDFNPAHLFRLEDK